VVEKTITMDEDEYDSGWTVKTPKNKQLTIGSKRGEQKQNSIEHRIQVPPKSNWIVCSIGFKFVCPILPPIINS